ncbi:F-box protein SKIP19 [Corchorus olitorius]|uniref:F-box protein SKIP19 n=1 Tax=Corchorus olitorius TaxID=93759 RepID=A0A1R3IIJ9_9ROSI|nr:F-box protein SKIP19 [Corchorus olitorius]
MSLPIDKKARMGLRRWEYLVGLRRWEDLDSKILKNIFNRTEEDDMDMVYASGIRVQHGMNKFASFLRRIMEGNDAHGNPLDRWRQSISKIIIPFKFAYILEDDLLRFIAKRTPAQIGKSYPYVEMIEQIGKSYPQLTSIEFCSCDHEEFCVDMKIAQAIVRSLPKLTTLRFQTVSLFKQAVAFISDNCPELKVIHCDDCFPRSSRFSPFIVRSYTFDCLPKGKGQDLEW